MRDDNDRASLSGHDIADLGCQGEVVQSFMSIERESGSR